MKFDLTTIKPIIENKKFALYTLGYINDNLCKGVRLDKITGEQTEVKIELKPRIRVVEIITLKGIQKLY